MDRSKPKGQNQQGSPGASELYTHRFYWFQVVVAELTGAPVLAHLRWWTTRGEAASQKQVCGPLSDLIHSQD